MNPPLSSRPKRARKAAKRRVLLFCLAASLRIRSGGDGVEPVDKLPKNCSILDGFRHDINNYPHEREHLLEQILDAHHLPHRYKAPVLALF